MPERLSPVAICQENQVEEQGLKCAMDVDNSYTIYLKLHKGTQ